MGNLYSRLQRFSGEHFILVWYKEEYTMPGTKYTEKQERKADHIAESYEEKGVSKKEAEARAWATVNKQDGGGKKPGGSGRKKAKD